jgi:hypothetical protein
MENRTESIAAIHDWHLEQVLEDLGLLSAIKSNHTKCAICDQPITLENLGGILVQPAHSYAIVCDKPECLEYASKDQKK